MCFCVLVCVEGKGQKYTAEQSMLFGVDCLRFAILLLLFAWWFGKLKEVR